MWIVGDKVVFNIPSAENYVLNWLILPKECVSTSIQYHQRMKFSLNGDQVKLYDNVPEKIKCTHPGRRVIQLSIKEGVILRYKNKSRPVIGKDLKISKNGLVESGIRQQN